MPAKARGKGEGGIRYRADKELYVGTIELERGPGGTRRRKDVYAKTKPELLAKMRAEQGRATQGLAPTQARLTVESWLAQWLDAQRSAKRLKESTLVNYHDVIRVYILPHVGHVQIVKLTPADVTRMLVALEEAGKSANTRRLARSVLARALRSAEQQGLLARNAARLADGPSTTDAYVGRTLTVEQARALLDGALGHELEGVVALALGLGLRLGEVLALTWDDVDFERSQLAISGTLLRLPGKGLVRQDPKTVRSRRTLGLPDPVLDALRRQRERQAFQRRAGGPGWNGHGYVFTTSAGRPLDPANVRHGFQELSERVLGDRWRPHELRHSAASLLLAAGVPLRTIADVLGHSSMQVTADVYAHLLPGLTADALDRLARSISAT